MIQSFRAHYVYSEGGTCMPREWERALKSYIYPLGEPKEEALVQVRLSACVDPTG